MGNEEGALRVNTKLKKSDKLPEVDHIIVEEEEKESAVTDSGYFKTEMASSAKPVNQTASSHNLNTTEEVPLLTTDQTPEPGVNVKSGELVVDKILTDDN